MSSFQAFTDYKADYDDRNGDFHCFCLKNFANPDIKFPDGKTYCVDWQQDYWLG